MTKPKETMNKPIPTSTITEQLGNCISDGQTWLTPADAGAVCLSLKLARCLDTIFETGEDLDKAAPLIGRLTALMRELKLTPLARDSSKATAEEVDSGIQYAQNYLRLVSTPSSKPKATRQKPRTNSRKPSQ